MSWWGDRGRNFCGFDRNLKSSNSDENQKFDNMEAPMAPGRRNFCDSVESWKFEISQMEKFKIHKWKSSKSTNEKVQNPQNETLLSPQILQCLMMLVLIMVIVSGLILSKQVPIKPVDAQKVCSQTGNYEQWFSSRWTIIANICWNLDPIGVFHYVPI